MARDCGACSDLQENSADFVVNGVTETVCNSLKNNTGFNTASSNDDCTDLDYANDCLIGNMEDEVDSYEVCDWKTFMATFIHNLWSVLKAMICSMCGLWTKAENAECQIGALMNGINFEVGEDSSDGSYVAAGKGVSFLGTGDEEGKAQVTLRYIAGGLAQVTGTLLFFENNFTDTGSCTNFDNGAVERTSTSRKGNSEWAGNTHAIDTSYYGTKKMTAGGELLYEIRILKSEYPMIKKFFAGFGTSTGDGEYHVNFLSFEEGDYAYGQHGSCNTSTGAARHNGDDDGHLVPTGWIYVQARMISITYLADNTGSTAADAEHKYTPRGFMGIRLYSDQIECGSTDDSTDEEE